MYKQLNILWLIYHFTSIIVTFQHSCISFSHHSPRNYDTFHNFIIGKFYKVFNCF